MKRRNFIRNTAALAAVSVVPSGLSASASGNSPREYYEFREYRFPGGGGLPLLKTYLSEAVIPLMNRFEVTVGAFGEYSLEEPPKVYTLFAYPDFATFIAMQQEFQSNKQFLDAAGTYLKSDPKNPVFTRYETFLLEAFEGKPRLEIPQKSRGLFELRTYESYNEDAGCRKVAMFNHEELALFGKVGLQSVFFGKIIAGPQMPALTYMLWFNDMPERDKLWARFRESEEWKVMKAKPEYADTVSKVNKKFLVPLDYSQI